MTELELMAEIRGLRELLLEKVQAAREMSNERVAAERIRVEAALAAVKEQTAASFAASEKAIVKAEDAQRTYNASHNDLARKMSEQSKEMMPRPEADAKFSSLEGKIAALKEDVTKAASVLIGARTLKDDNRASLGIWIALGAILTGLLGALAGKAF